jgi:glycosyltransferase involved in cell wall biosynthesis
MNYPLVSLGMPVFNEDRFIRSALEALVKQDYDNFELTIYDNCSTDNTQDICQEFSDKYSFVTYTRHPINIGAAENFKYAQENATGKYFMWATGHDFWSKNLVTECVSALESNPTATISFATSSWIDEYSAPISAKQSGWADTRGLSPVARFYFCLWGNMHPILGLIRLQSLSESKPFQTVIGADLVVLSELSLKGDFIHAQSAKWSRRHFRKDETYRQRVKRYKSNGYSLLDKKLSNTFPALTLALELIKVVMRADLTIVIKTITLLVLLPTMALKYLTSVKQTP